MVVVATPVIGMCLIEHRLFPHITRVCQGIVFHSLAIAKHFMAKAKTTTGLKVTVDILTGVYVTGKKCAWILSKTGVLFLMTTSRVGIIDLSHNTTNIGKLFLAISLYLANHWSRELTLRG